MKNFALIVSLLIVTLFTACNNDQGKKSSGEKITLKPNFKAGESYTLDCKMDMNQEIMGMHNIMNMGFGYKMDVKDATANDINMNMTFSRISMNMQSPAIQFSYNSDSSNSSASTAAGPAEAMQGAFKVFDAMVGKSISVTLDANGKVKEVKGYNELLQSVMDSAKGTGIPSEALKTSMNEDQIKQVYQQAFGMYPGKPVGVGDKWSVDMKINQSGMPMATKTNYTVKEINPIENEVILDVDGTIGTEGDGTVNTNGVNMKMKMKGTQKGEMTVDSRTGFVKDCKLIQDIKAEMEVMGQNMPLDMKNTITLFGKKN